MTDHLEVLAIRSLPVIHEPTSLVDLLLSALKADGIALIDDDVVVVAQKLVSKAEGAYVDLRSVEPGPRAREIAEATGKDPRLVEVILSESRAVVKVSSGHLITEHRLGYVCANAGVDMSNSGAQDRAVLLPEDPDASARRLRLAIGERCSADVSVIVSDTHGRPFRNGAVGVAIGVAGVSALLSYRGEPDLDGRTLRTSEEAVADELAAAASLLMGQGAEGRPVVIVRGYSRNRGEGSHAELLRARENDLFR